MKLDSLLEGLRIEIEVARKKRDRASKVAQQAQLEFAAAEEEFTSLVKAEKALAKRRVRSVHRPVSAESVRTDVSVAVAGSALTAELGQTGRNGSHPNKAEMIRLYLRDHMEGSTPVEIFKALEASGVARNYVHSTLFRMKSSGAVIEERGKYRLTK
jgi:hypothetical protein